MAVLLVGSCTLEIVDYPGGARPATCGNGIVDASGGEVCDDGNTTDGDGCSRDCRSLEACGNGIVDASGGEVCDDGNTIDGDGCSRDCRSLEACGNGIVDASGGEQCDSGGIDTLSCNGATCTVALCGDGYLNVTAGEQCDNGPNNGPPPSPCSLTCQLAPP